MPGWSVRWLSLGPTLLKSGQELDSRTSMIGSDGVHELVARQSILGMVSWTAPARVISRTSNLYWGATETEISTDPDEVGPVADLALTMSTGSRIVAANKAVCLHARASLGGECRLQFDTAAANRLCLPWSIACAMVREWADYANASLQFPPQRNNRLAPEIALCCRGSVPAAKCEPASSLTEI